MVVIIFGKKKGMVAFLKFFTFQIFICEGLYDPDTGKSVLQTGVNISNLAAVFHESFLHLAVLSERKEEHHNDQDR